MSAQKIGVGGGGLMGHGIAYLLAAAGHDIGCSKSLSDVRATAAGSGCGPLSICLVTKRIS